MRRTLALSLTAALALASPASAQVVQTHPHQLYVDGVPAACGGVAFALDPNLPDVGMARPGVIILNPNVLAGMSSSMKLFWIAHECGHHAVGANEAAADCWAIRLGRNQGWFPPWAFEEMIYQFRFNPGDFTHAPGPQRVQQMMTCYESI